jgi:ABC-type lipoprotein release transport system permease subunit
MPTRLTRRHFLQVTGAGAVATLASYLPARRGMRMTAVDALRTN